MDEISALTGGGCPIAHGPRLVSNRDWWPNQLNLKILHQHSALSNPMGETFDYAVAFKRLDLKALKDDIFALMKTSQEWWPADYGHYGPLFIRMAWHAAGTYRTADGRGGGGTGSQRFAPLNSWPDNTNLDKARMLLWPVKKKYGKSISWADLMILAGNCALESMGLKTFGFGGGRADIWEPEEDIYWGAETDWLGDKRYTGDRLLEMPLAAVQMGLIYVKTRKAPNGNPDPVASGRDIRETFARMAMNRRGDRRARRRRPQRSASATRGRRREPRARARGRRARAAGAGLEEQFRHRQGRRHHHQRYRGGVDAQPRSSGTLGYFDVLFGYQWELTKSPAGAWQNGPPIGLAEKDHAPQVDGSGARVPIMMTTADMAMKMDPVYEQISRRFHQNPDLFADAFARAWFKLTHRDMGPRELYLGSEVPEEVLIWQDPVPAVDHPLVDATDIAELKAADPRHGAPRVRSGDDGVGVRVELPRLRQARRRQRRAASARAAEGLGGQPVRRRARDDRGARGHQGRLRRRPHRRQEGLSRRPHRARRLGGRRGGGPHGRPRDRGALHPGAHGCHPRARPTSSPSRRWSRRRTASATTRRRPTGSPRKSC